MVDIICSQRGREAALDLLGLGQQPGPVYEGEQQVVAVPQLQLAWPNFTQLIMLQSSTWRGRCCAGAAGVRHPPRHLVSLAGRGNAGSPCPGLQLPHLHKLQHSPGQAAHHVLVQRVHLPQVDRAGGLHSTGCSQDWAAVPTFLAGRV